MRATKSVISVILSLLYLLLCAISVTGVIILDSLIVGIMCGFLAVLFGMLYLREFRHFLRLILPYSRFEVELIDGKIIICGRMSTSTNGSIILYSTTGKVIVDRSAIMFIRHFTSDGDLIVYNSKSLEDIRGK